MVKEPFREFSQADPNEATALPRVLVTLSKGMVTVRSDAPLRLTLIFDDLELRCDDVPHVRKPEELDVILRSSASFRNDPSLCQVVNLDQ